ncbi:MAG: TM0106 family RecB-like putative nuclease [SAR202 cluster bacterium]|nr:TM0106 family RecB-like putative nuclease [SAR202 cluster bacterium]OUU77953.1 MAG: hypothetical protein CBC30_00265 [Chloroflexi bacterium TMED70]
MKKNKNITAYSIQDFSQCQHKTWLDFLEPPKDFSKNYDPWLEIIRKIGIEHEKNYLDELRKSENIYEIDKNLSFEEKENLTDKAIKRNEKIIYQPYLRYKKFTGSPDFLVFKDNYYEPWDVKSAFRLKPENILQLCHYSYILDKKYSLLPNSGKIILRDQSSHDIEIGKYYEYFLNIKNRILDFINSQNEIPEASKCNLCNVCDYKLLCESNWKKEDHLNQVANIKKNQIKFLQNQNIDTLEKLSTIDSNIQIKGINKNSLEILKLQSSLQFHERNTKKLEYKIIFDQKKEISDPNKLIGFEILPEPSHNDLFFDIEGYPMYFDENSKSSGLEYLFGIYYRSFGQETFLKFVAINHEEEKKAFEDLIDFIFSHLKKYKDAHIYHYNAYEETALKKLSQKYETKIFEVDFILREKKLIDLFKVVKDSLLISAENYKLKTIEKFYQINREEDISSGQDSLVAFEKYLDSGHDEILEEIILYNKQDCKSLIYLQNWLNEIKPKHINFNKKDLIDEKISESNLEQIQIEKNLSLTIENLDESEKEIKPILDQLNFYNRKEQRPDWWSFFSNKEKDTEDLIEDNNCIGGLNLTNESNDGNFKILNFKYPEQITKMKPGDTVLDQNGENSSRILSVDYKNFEVKIRLGKNKIPPLSLTPSQPLNTKSIDNAVAEFIKDYSYKNSYPAIKSLLHKKDTSYKGKIEFNNSIEAIKNRIKNMNNSYIVMQGPPGTGKSYTSSRIILDLIESNYRIAIVCHSHKAIINLIKSIDDFAIESKVSFKGIYKSSSGKTDHQFSNIQIGDTNKVNVKDYQLVAGTTWALSNSNHRINSKEDKNFDYIFFDEAGQMSISKVIASSLSAKNIVLIGDHMQLPQPTTGNIEGESSLSPIEYLISEKNTISNDKGIFLDKSYRMHSSVCEFISDSFYEKRLDSDILNKNQKIIINNKEINNGIFVADINHSDYSVQNIEEAHFTKNIYEKLINNTWINRENKKKKITQKDILVVSPFNAQVNLIKEEIPEAQVGTIDNFQGQEAPIVIVSYTSSDPENIPRGSDFFFDFRRLNVSISRAKCLAIILLNSKLLNFYCSSIEDMERLNYFCKLNSLDNNIDKLINTLD